MASHILSQRWSFASPRLSSGLAVSGCFPLFLLDTQPERIIPWKRSRVADSSPLAKLQCEKTGAGVLLFPLYTGQLTSIIFKKPVMVRFIPNEAAIASPRLIFLALSKRRWMHSKKTGLRALNYKLLTQSVDKGNVFVSAVCQRSRRTSNSSLGLLVHSLLWAVGKANNAGRVKQAAFTTFVDLNMQPRFLGEMYYMVLESEVR